MTTTTAPATTHSMPNAELDTPEVCTCGAAFYDGFNLQAVKLAHLAAWAEQGEAEAPHTLPSGNTISADTWAAMASDGTWRGWLDRRMYSEADRAYMDKALAHNPEEQTMDTNTCTATVVHTMDGRTVQHACTKDTHPAKQCHATIVDGVTVTRWWSA